MVDWILSGSGSGGAQKWGHFWRKDLVENFAMVEAEVATNFKCSKMKNVVNLRICKHNCMGMG